MPPRWRWRRGAPGRVSARLSAPAKGRDSLRRRAADSRRASGPTCRPALKGRRRPSRSRPGPPGPRAHDAAIRARLAQGDEDSVVNLWLYGTTFTTLPRATEQEMASLGPRARAEELLLRRLDDLVAGHRVARQRTSGSSSRASSSSARGSIRRPRRARSRRGSTWSRSGSASSRSYARYRRAAESARRPGSRRRADRLRDDLQRSRAVVGHEADRRLRARQGDRSDRARRGRFARRASAASPSSGRAWTSPTRRKGSTSTRSRRSSRSRWSTRSAGSTWGSPTRSA